MSISEWSEQNGLRIPHYRFTGVVPERHSARIGTQLVGMGLLEAIPESAIEALEDPDDRDGDGISGRMHIVTDLETGQHRLGRFGWKAGKATVKQQVAAALNRDIGVMTSVLPTADRGSLQAASDNDSIELPDVELIRLSTYVSLLGVPARRSLGDPVTTRGQALFGTVGCTGCHTPTVRIPARGAPRARRVVGAGSPGTRAAPERAVRLGRGRGEPVRLALREDEPDDAIVGARLGEAMRLLGDRVRRGVSLPRCP